MKFQTLSCDSNMLHTEHGKQNSTGTTQYAVSIVPALSSLRAGLSACT